MKWLELGRALQNLPQDIDINHIEGCNELSSLLKDAFLSEVDELDNKEMNHFKIETGDPKIKSKEELIRELGKLIDEVNDCMSKANDDTDEARAFMRKLLFTDVLDYKIRRDFVTNLSKKHSLYRMRDSQTYRCFGSKELYVVSEKKSGWIGMARFNASGKPFLYLAESLYTAWEEMRRPDFHKANFVRFETCRELKVLDLTVPDEPNSFYKLVRSYLALACGMKVVADKERHHWQYEMSTFISRLLSHAIATGKPDLDGIRYHSSRRFEADFNIDNSQIALAYVFIPQTVPDKDYNYCPYLASKFKMTEPTSYFFLKVHRHRFNSVKDPNTSDYKHTIFYELEEILKKQPVSSCSGLVKK